MDEKPTILKLQKEIERLKKSVKKQRYGLVWMDVPEAFDNDVENKLPILKEVPELAIKNDDGEPTHILIEGDNYHALTCLNYTHGGKIDVIYIDPPYNTGSDGFRYKDKRVINKFPDGTEVPKDHPFRHSYWLSFMRKRLELARELLKDTGVIFISIDDNELAQLKLLCDDVFDAKNFENIFTIKVRHESRILRQDIRYQQTTEYLLCYQAGDFIPARLPITKDKIKDYAYDISSLKSKPRRIEKIGGYDVEIYKSADYKLEEVGPGKGNFKMYSIRGSLITQKGSASEFYEKFLRKRRSLDGLGALYRVIGMGMRGDGIGYRFILQPLKKNIKNGFYLQGRPLREIALKGLPYSNYWDLVNEFNNVGYEGGVEFKSGKKPIAFIKKILELSDIKEGAIVLDFFAGSGSTLQAVAEYANENDIHCQVILVTNNENDIMRSACYPRVKNVIKGLNGVEKYGGSLKYFKSAFIGKNNILNATDEDKVELAHNAGGLLAIAENTLELVKQNKFYQLFEDGNKEKYTAVYFREELDKFEEFVEMVEKLKKGTTVYIFSWGDEEFIDDFSHIKDVRIKTIPKPILEIYKNIYNLGA